MNRMWLSDRGAVAPESVRPRLAIVSTYDELCGIACYTRALERQLSASFDVTVMDLDQYLLRSPHRAVQKLADAHIRQIAKLLRGFDSVNIQLEHGTLGATPTQILRRFGILSRAASRLSVTFHTVLPAEPFDWARLMLLLGQLKFSAAGDLWYGHRRAKALNNGVYRILRRLQRSRPTTVIVHTKRDMRLLRDVYRLWNVLHHPLSFVMPAERKHVYATVRRQNFPLIRRLSDDAHLVGVFGFVSDYKGFDTAIRALHLLPERHHLLIFGGVHPQTIRKHTPIDSCVRGLLDLAHVDRTLLDDLAGNASGSSIQLSLDGNARDLFQSHPKSLVGRVHFMGALTDAEFLAAMSVCDDVVLSYQEVGQSASGPMSIALEMGCRVIASRTNTFLAYARYHPGQFEFFDIGNHLELAERLTADSPIDCRNRVLAYDWASNLAIYEQANGLPSKRPNVVPGERTGGMTLVAR